MKFKNKVVLVTGGAGFIGSHFTDFVMSVGAEKVIVVDNLFLGRKDNISQHFGKENFLFVKGDIANYELMNKVFRENNVDVCFNFAIIPLPSSLKNPHWTFVENMKQIETITKLLYEGAYETLIHVSSSEAYGSAIEIPMKEDHILRPKTTYAASKAAQDHLVIAYYETFKLDAAIVRPFNNYGPRQNTKRFAGLIPTTISRILENKPPIIAGNGEQTRDFIFVKDTVEAISRAYSYNTIGEIINICSNKEVSVKEIVTKICSLMDYNGEIKFVEERIGDVKRHLGSNEKCKRLLKFSPKTSLDVGLKITVDAYLKKRPNQIFI